MNDERVRFWRSFQAWKTVTCLLLLCALSGCFVGALLLGGAATLVITTGGRIWQANVTHRR